MLKHDDSVLLDPEASLLQNLIHHGLTFLFRFLEISLVFIKSNLYNLFSIRFIDTSLLNMLSNMSLDKCNFQILQT